MSEKLEIIQQMLDMQKKFIAIEQAGKFSSEEYYDPDGEGGLAEHKRVFDDLARKLVDIAHAEKGSHR
ncbi:MAG: hypothetical protein ACI9LO_000631 [Planctomycetota bacterium]|jgi:hypothetical protein